MRGLVKSSWFVLAFAIAACSGRDDGAAKGGRTVGGAGGRATGGNGATAGGPRGGASGRAASGGRPGAAGSAVEGGGGPDAPAGAAGAPGTAGEGDAGGSGEGGAHSELDEIYNLVDAEAAAELEGVLTAGMFYSYTTPGSFRRGVNGFLERFREEYDFVFLVLDHDVSSNVYGFLEPVNLEVIPGTGHDVHYRKPGYKTNGRLKGAAGFRYIKGGFGPFGHEFLHHWANSLDQSFGFGVGLDFPSSGHWGYAGVHGQLGGFDPETLHCATPAGAAPPGCTAEANGRYRYVTSPFGPSTNGITIPYAPLELYLMGLVPRSEVPTSIPVLENAKVVSRDADTYTLEADGIKTVSMADIVARHGEVELLPSDRRAFRLAMVVVSSAPADADVLAEVAHFNAIFGNRVRDAELPSFEALTGGRATLDTRLGARRSASEPPPEEVPWVDCDLVAQDCEGEGEGCFSLGEVSACALSGGAGAGEPCEGDDFDCAPGLDCRADKAGTSLYCSPYCDAKKPDSPLYCPTLCPDYVLFGTPNGEVLAGMCILK